jgi:hypothetical protein
VTDTVTGLVWLKDANCYGLRTYAGANQEAAGLADGHCGLTDGSLPGDWRLPTQAEWEVPIHRAVVLGCQFSSFPSLPNDPGTACLSQGPTSFTGVQDLYWSSSTVDSNPNIAWFANLVAGGEVPDSKSALRLVWPVRGGR